MITTSRSDFGLLEPVMRGALADSRFDPLLIVCGQNLAAGTPLTSETADLPTLRLQMPGGTIDAVPQAALVGALQSSQSMIALVLGDRFELLSVSECCTFLNLPIAHCSGGERTLGAIDDQIRDAVTKLSHLHFVSHQPAAERIAQLGEETWRVSVTGDPGLDSLLHEERMSPQAVDTLLGAEPSRKDILVALHPVTRSLEETTSFLQSISDFCETFEGRVFFSAANGDPGSQLIDSTWNRLSERLPHCQTFSSIGAQAFRGLIAACGALVGNSSSGIWEAPSLGTPSLDLGTRQRGRIRGSSVLHCEAGDARELAKKIRQLFSPEIQSRCAAGTNPYGDGHATQRILDHIWREIQNPNLMFKA